MADLVDKFRLLARMITVMDFAVWTVNDTIAMSTMISRGADNLITDHPDLA